MEIKIWNSFLPHFLHIKSIGLWDHEEEIKKRSVSEKRPKKAESQIIQSKFSASLKESSLPDICEEDQGSAEGIERKSTI